ncbi:hypothetical protein RHMOL_Rhmol06G0133700 [Rhododendron molle]|uniref:Uncharacterized protein n=1 Tax=Rhododendron molle TaxID=49168 RepID=A0ACC0NC67_RHOML|nr:hypothetical protein RHMOL_Rhmol06G0133700 [Rhododendron molle]
MKKTNHETHVVQALPGPRWVDFQSMCMPLRINPFILAVTSSIEKFAVTRMGEQFGDEDELSKITLGDVCFVGFLFFLMGCSLYL